MSFVSEMYPPSQGSFDYPKGGYVRGLWEDMFLSCKGSARKSLSSHLHRDGSRPEEGVQPARRGRAAGHKRMCLGHKPLRPRQFVG